MIDCGEIEMFAFSFDLDTFSFCSSRQERHVMARDQKPFLTVDQYRRNIGRNVNKQVCLPLPALRSARDDGTRREEKTKTGI